LLDDCPEVKVNAVFSVYDDDESTKLINTLYYLHNNPGKSSSIEFLDKWYSADKLYRKTLYLDLAIENFNVAKQIGEENKSLFEKYKVPGTPTIFINGYKFPTQYEYSDIEYYIDEIKNLTMESKRQEACANCH
jgi:hypothetical protein